MKQPDESRLSGLTSDRGRRLKALGSAVKIARLARGLSIENAAKAAGVGHMTWRRVEEGSPVRDQTYAALDGAHALQPGTVSAAAGNDAVLVGLAVKLGAAPAEQAIRLDEPEFVAALAGERSFDEPTLKEQVTAAAKADSIYAYEMVTEMVMTAPLTEVLIGLLRRLMAKMDRDGDGLTPQESAILQALREWNASHLSVRYPGHAVALPAPPYPDEGAPPVTQAADRAR